MDFVEGVRAAANRAGKALDLLRFRKRDYCLTFNALAGQNVLIDLARFCRANETCYSDDPRKHAVAEGRREVWLRIQQHLQLDPMELFELYRGNTIQPRLMTAPEKEDD